MVILPAIMAVVLPTVFVLTTGRVGLGSMGSLESVTRLLANLPPDLRASLARFDSLHLQAIYFAVNYLFAPFFLLIPLMTSSVVAANSFVGEKERRTLESLLFAPVDMEALGLFGGETEVVFQSHNWPHWGNDVIRTYMENTAAMYKTIHNQTLGYINRGYTAPTLAFVLQSTRRPDARP